MCRAFSNRLLPTNSNDVFDNSCFPTLIQTLPVMSTPASSTFQPDTPITIKVSHDGSNKKVKLPFSDLAADSFEDKVRHLWHFLYHSFIITDNSCSFVWPSASRH